MTRVWPHSRHTWRPFWSVTQVHHSLTCTSESCIHLKSKPIPPFDTFFKLAVPSSSSLPQIRKLSFVAGTLRLVTGQTPRPCGTAATLCVLRTIPSDSRCLISEEITTSPNYALASVPSVLVSFVFYTLE